MSHDTSSRKAPDNAQTQAGPSSSGDTGGSGSGADSALAAMLKKRSQRPSHTEPSIAPAKLPVDPAAG